MEAPVSVVSGCSRLPITRSEARSARTRSKKPSPSRGGMSRGASLIMMSPVADIVMACAVPDSLSVRSGAAEPDGFVADGFGSAAAGSCQIGRGTVSRFARATLPAPAPARTAKTIVTVRTGRPKRPEDREGGGEFIDGDDTARWQADDPVEWLIIVRRLWRWRRPLRPIRLPCGTLIKRCPAESRPRAPRLIERRRCACSEVQRWMRYWRAAEFSRAWTRRPPRRSPRRWTLFNEGEAGDSLYIVLSGKIKLGRRAADGRQNLVSIMGPSDMVGELSLFDPGPRTATATAVTDARLARLKKTSLRPWLNNRPEIAEQLLRVLARRLRRTNDALADLIFTDVPGRVAKNLLQMAGRFGTRDGGVLRVTHDLTQEELAQLVGASRETVNKALADFASRAWLRLDGKSVIILDPERLARRARV